NLYRQGKKWLAAICGERDMFSEHEHRLEEKQVTEHLLSNVENILLNGPQLILYSKRIVLRLSQSKIESH
ncbi:MAG: hypothetical protein LBJ58_00380, partial [Tannerellaceae bacterium]|nr:hypothetical protein [Tannerellaceae bacterium]